MPCYIADLHIHSHYAGATSPSLSLETVYQLASIKGIDVVGTGHFTHPAWLKELEEKITSFRKWFLYFKATI